MRSRETKPPPAVCPSCGVDVPETALACPECGADYETGWKEDAAVYDGLDLPDPEFDHAEFAKREFGDEALPLAPKKRRWSGSVVIAIIAVAFLLLWVWAQLE